MAIHCPHCDSTDIQYPLVSPRGIKYGLCNECGRKFTNPVVDPEAAPVETQQGEEPQQ